MSGDALTRARLMARIAAPLLAATIRQSDGKTADAEALAQRFASDINMVVPLTQLLVEVIKPADEDEKAAVNTIAAPLAAALVSQNPDLAQAGEGLTRLLKPSLNVLASFCDSGDTVAGLFDEMDGLPGSMLALSPIVGCLSQHAFGKSPAKRLTDTLDAYSRARKDMLADLPKSMRIDGPLNIALQTAAAQLFASHFESATQDGTQEDKSSADAEFKNLLAQWTQSLLLLAVLLRHAAGEGDTASPAVRASRKKQPAAQDRDDEGDDDETAGGSGGGGGRAQTMQAGYNPMSFFAKKGV